MLFEEKLDLLREAARRGSGHLGGHDPAAADRAAGLPEDREPARRPWVGVGGSPESVVRAARHGLPLVLAIIGGQPARFAPYVDLYHRALAQLGQPTLPVAVHSPGLRRRHRPGGGRHPLAASGGHDEPHRQGARLAPHEPRALRGRDPRGRAARRLARDGRAEDRRHRAHPGHPALRPQVHQRHRARTSS